MKLSDLDLVIPTEDMLFILNNCNPISFVMMEVDFNNFHIKKNNPCN